MTPRRSVLVIDQLKETEVVLRTALERRGVEVLAAHGAVQAARLADEHRPDLIVVDLEMEELTRSPDARRLTLDGQTPKLLLGSVRRLAEGVPNGRFVAKPYHYAPLILTIEVLLEQASSSAGATSRGSRPAARPHL